MSKRANPWTGAPRAGITLLFLLFSAWACVPAPDPPADVLFVDRQPPPPLGENVGLPPRPGVVWRRGVWRWDGNDYQWVPGQWVVLPVRQAAWVPGRWVRTRRGWYFVEGHWR